MTGGSQAPKDLHLLTEANKLTLGEKRALYMSKVDEHTVTRLTSRLAVTSGNTAGAQSLVHLGFAEAPPHRP